MNYQAIITDIKDIISSGQKIAYNATNKAMILTYWHVGKRIVEQEQNGNERAQYGQALIDALADELTKEYGKSFSKRNLQYFRKFYIAFPDERIVNACVHNLTWTHFRSLLRVPDENARLWYMNEASNEGWSSRTLDRNISTQYFYRLMQSPKKNDVVNEMLLKNSENQKNQHPQPLLHPHPLPQPLLRPSPLPHPPQQIRSRMIHRQLSLPQPLPHPPQPLPPQPPQQQRRRMIHRQELFSPHPFPFPPQPQLFAHPLSQPHPQFVAVNSLMLNPPDRFILQFYSMPETKKCSGRI